MRADLKEKLIEALESGKYTQIQKRWKSDKNEFCATALLYELMGIEWEESKWDPWIFAGCTPVKTKWFIPKIHDKSEFDLPIGYNASFLQKITDYEVKMAEIFTIIDMNDYKDKTFKEIAKWLRTQST